MTTAPERILPEEREIEQLAADLDAATRALDELSEDGRAAAERLVRAHSDLHRAALVALVRGLREDERGRELLFELVDDPTVRMTLLLHGLIRQDPATLARAVLDRIRPQLQSHGGDVELDRVENGVAFVRLSGACNGCSMSAVTMRDGVEKELLVQVPGLTAVEVLPNEPGPAIIPLGDIGFRRSDPGPGWAPAGAVTDFELGTITVRDLSSAESAVEAIVVNLGGQLAAYVNACPHLGNSLEDADLDPSDGTLTCAWHGFCYDALSGECHTLPGAQLAPLPLRVEDGLVWIRTAV